METSSTSYSYGGGLTGGNGCPYDRSSDGSGGKQTSGGILIDTQGTNDTDGYNALINLGYSAGSFGYGIPGYWHHSSFGGTAGGGGGWYRRRSNIFL